MSQPFRYHGHAPEPEHDEQEPEALYLGAEELEVRLRGYVDITSSGRRFKLTDLASGEAYPNGREVGQGDKPANPFVIFQPLEQDIWGDGL